MPKLRWSVGGGAEAEVVPIFIQKEAGNQAKPRGKHAICAPASQQEAPAGGAGPGRRGSKRVYT